MEALSLFAKVYPYHGLTSVALGSARAPAGGRGPRGVIGRDFTGEVQNIHPVE